VEDNAAVFTMANIIPQTADNNQGVWEHLEADCRELAKAGNELLIICGPAGFNGTHIKNHGPVEVPASTWKIVVVVPAGAGPVLARIAATTRVIAVDIPNVAGIRHDPWQKYLVSVSQLEKLTGFKFFTALRPELAVMLKSKVDGQATPVAAMVEPVPAPAATAMPSADWITIGIVVLSLTLVVCVAVLALFFRTRPKAK
jgi:endonuclease G